MRQKLSNFYNPSFFHDQICARFRYAYIGRVLHNFTFRDNFACFSYVHGLPRDVEDAVLIRLVKSSNLSWLKRPDLTPSYFHK